MNRSSRLSPSYLLRTTHYALRTTTHYLLLTTYYLLQAMLAFLVCVAILYCAYRKCRRPRSEEEVQLAEMKAGYPDM